MVEITYLHHSFFKLKADGKSVLIDPVLKFKSPSKDFECLNKYSVKDKDLKNIALILITHEHFDHFDKEAVAAIAKENNACIVAHHNILHELNGLVPKSLLHPISMQQKISLRGIEVEAIAAHHPQAFYPMGFLLKMGGKSIYHAGDTDLITEMEQMQPDVALLPIGGGETMDCVDAVRAVKLMKPQLTIPMHYNTFRAIQQDPKEFKQKIEKSILKTKVIVLDPGKKTVF